MITFWPSKMITFRVLSFILSFGVIIYFMLSFHVIIFDVIIWCYHFVLSFGVIICLMLSFDVIISHSLQMLSFLCYHFSFYSMGVIIYVIIYCYHFLLSYPPFFLFPENVTHFIFVAEFSNRGNNEWLRKINKSAKKGNAAERSKAEGLSVNFPLSL